MPDAWTIVHARLPWFYFEDIAAIARFQRASQRLPRSRAPQIPSALSFRTQPLVEEPAGLDQGVRERGWILPDIMAGKKVRR
jgi:hypothetical protein